MTALEAAVEAFRDGHPVLIVGGEQDAGSGPPLHFLALNASHASADKLNALVRLSGGLLYVCLTPARVDALGLHRSSFRNEQGWQRRLLQSFDAAASPDKGISMAARAAAVSLAIDPAARPADVRQPGHMLGLEAAPAGTLERLGYTEAAVDLARIVGGAAAIISEVLSPTGGVADEDRLQSLVAQHGIPRVDVAEIARASAHSPEAFRIAAETSLPTKYGSFKAIAISSPLDASPYVALTSGDVYSGAPLVSVHLRCVAGALRSKACSCGEQIDHAMQLISREGGILLHLPRQTTHDVAAGDEDLAVSAIADGELAALLLRRLRISRIRAIVPSLLMEPGPEFGLDIVDAVDLKEALS